MAMRKAFTGGACAPGGDGQTMGNNAFTNMMDHMISGGASAQQKAEGYGTQIDNAHMGAMEAAYEQQQKMDSMNQQFDNMNIQGPQMMHPQPMPQETVANVDQMNDLWNKPIENIQDVRTDKIEDKFANMQNHSQNMMFGPPGMMSQMFMPPMSQGFTQQPNFAQPNEVQEEVKTEEINEVSKEDEQKHRDEMKELANAFANDLETIPNEKIKNSEFVSFLKKLGTGALEVEKDGLKEDSAKLAQFEQDQIKQKAMEKAYRESAINQMMEESKDPERFFKMEDALQGKEFKEKFDNEFEQEFDPTNLFRDVWDAGEMNEDELQSMMANWKSHAEKNMTMFNDTIKEQPVETTIKVAKKDIFKFDENNPYLEHDDAYKLAVEMNEDLRVHEAIKALEAHLQKNPDHAQSWRLLGQLYQENDEDDKAIAYFQKAYDLDPFDLKSLLCLGVSCTNELQESVAMGHLMNWLKYNPDYSDLQFPEGEILDVNQLRETLKDLFLMANQKNPHDVDVMVCLGVIEFGERNYLRAAEHFGQAIKENPTDYNLWNKYGAGLANNFSTEQALEIYEQTLELRPNLVRTWANIGIAYCNQDKYAIAVPKFLNALALNPNADHIWNYLHSCFWAMKEFDKCELVKKRNVEFFRGDYDIINPDMLPKPSMDKLFNHPHLAS